MDRVTKTAPDGDATGTGSSDPYLGDLARQQRSLDTQGTCPGEAGRTESDGDDRGDYGDGCYDPYVAGIARDGRSTT